MFKREEYPCGCVLAPPGEHTSHIDFCEKHEPTVLLSGPLSSYWMSGKAEQAEEIERAARARAHRITV